MTQPVIAIEHLSKMYRLGQPAVGGYATLRDRIAAAPATWWRSCRRSLKPHRTSFDSTEFWALQDLSLEIHQGDRIGIIGRNGAGKSTLLKLLSRITEPTTGRISLHGRVASLLEVGTGFHPELTGRENIYLNGAILGMSKAEIRRNFDEIVAFAEVAQFLDTPVKRYSSGMYVRLAFAVAAHLEPDILIVDEVLAVGDAQFQKKCLGKMQDVSSQQGRTVLFVSHNMEAIQRLCSRCVLLDSGRAIAQGETAACVAQYLSRNTDRSTPTHWIDVSGASRLGTGEARFVAVRYSSLNPATGYQAYANGPLEFQLEIESQVNRAIGSLAVTLYSQSGTKLVNADTAALGETLVLREGRNTVSLRIASLHLKPDIYVLGLWLAYLSANETHEALDFIESAFELEVVGVASAQVGVQILPNDGAVTCEFALLTPLEVSR